MFEIRHQSSLVTAPERPNAMETCFCAQGGGAQTLVVSALPDKFVTGCITAKLSQTWTDFATSLKHKRQEFGIANLIGSLDVEEKARAKDVRGKKVVECPCGTETFSKLPQEEILARSQTKEHYAF